MNLSVLIVVAILFASILLMSLVYMASASSGGRRDVGAAGKARRDGEATRDDEVDEASEESFPASDPPSSTTFHAGPPAR